MTTAEDIDRTLRASKSVARRVDWVRDPRAKVVGLNVPLAEAGCHHHVPGVCLLRYAQEAAWREDSRRVANGEQVTRVAELAMARKPSVDFAGYWQRRKAA